MSKQMRPLRTGLLLFFVMLGVNACTLSLAEDVTPPPGSELSVEAISAAELEFPQGAIDIENGAEIFAQSCVPCHGQSGLGDGPQAEQLPFPPLPIGDRALARESSLEKWYLQISNGDLDRFMPPFSQAYSVQERWNVLAYVIGLGIGPDASINAEELENVPEEFRSLKAIAPLSGTELFDIISENPAAQEKEYSAEETWGLVDGLQMLALGVDPLAVVSPSEDALPVGEIPASVSLNGLVINASGGPIPDELEVLLHIIVDGQEADTLHAAIGPQGDFLIEDFDLHEDDLYFFSVDFQGLSFFSNFYSAELLADAGLVEIEIYESARDTTFLKVELINLVFEFPAEGVVQVIEQVVISNNGDIAAAPGEGGAPLINYELPEGATNLIFEQGALGDRYIVQENGFGDIRAVLPGNNSYQILFGYQMPYSNGLDIEIPLQFATKDLAVFVPQGDVNIDNALFDYVGQQLVQTEIFDTYTYRLPLQQGSRVNVSIQGLHPLEQSSAQRLINDDNFLIGLFVLALAVGLGWWRYRNSDVQRDKPSKKKSKNAILNEIVALDEALESGSLSRRKHAKLREQKMNELRQKVGKRSK